MNQMNYKHIMYLVGGLEHFFFFHILGKIVPTDFDIFQGGGSTTNQYRILPVVDETCPVKIFQRRRRAKCGIRGDAKETAALQEPRKCAL